MKTLLLILLFGSPLLLPAEVQAATTTINVTGDILPETCDIDSGQLNQNFNLGEYGVASFPQTGSVTNNVPFSFKMTNCTAGISAAKIRFSGPQSINSQVFALQGGGGDIGLELLNSAGLVMAPGVLNRFVLVRGDNTLSFAMRLKSVKQPATPGNLSGTIFLDIEYE